MAYKKRTYRHRRRPAKGRKLNPRQKREVKRIVNGTLETKHYALSKVLTNVTSSGTIESFADPTLGTGAGSRIGEEIFLKKLALRFQFLVASGDEYDNVRVIIFRWHPDYNVDPPTLAQILDNGTFGTANGFLAPYNRTYVKKYKILYDKTYSLQNSFGFTSSGVLPVLGGTQVSYVQSTKLSPWIRLYGKRIGAKKITYTSSTHGINEICALVLSDSAPASATHPSYAFGGEIMYTDA